MRCCAKLCTTFVRCTRWKQLMNVLVACSVCCSVILLVLNSRLEPSKSSSEADQRQELNSFGSLPIFHAPFKLQQSTATKSYKSIAVELQADVRSLREELAYAQHALYEFEETNREKLASKTGCDPSYGIPKCQVLHIAIVCAGYTESRRVVTLIKSILFHRKHPLHFHFISDASAQLVLKTLFRTWTLQQVLINFYDTEKLTAEIDWIPNRHYSGVFGLMKLTLTKALPESIDRVIVLDTDVFFVSDVAELWARFQDFSKKQAIGLVENQSEWYLGKLWKNYKPWPALGRGFNTGVILLDLHKLRQMNWIQMWRMTAERELMNLLHTTLADQDVINAVIKDNPQIVYTIPCAWNIQLSDNTQSELCYEEVTELKLIHWNSPKKSSVNHKHGDYFRNMYLTFLHFDGNLLRRQLFMCDLGLKDATNQSDEKLAEDDPCYEFYQEQQLLRRVHLYYLDYDHKPIENDVTLLAHLSMDRLQILDSLVLHWEGPISLSLYVSDAEAQQFLRNVLKNPSFTNRKNIGVHLVYKDGDFYPVNYLRNVALEQVRTPFVFLSDIDFLPVPGLYEYLKNIASKTDMNKKAVIVPAFETSNYKLDFPRTKLHLLSLLEQGQISRFRFNVWPQGHAATDYEKWKTATEHYKISWAPDFEPYIMVKSNVERYDMRFVGFGWNKVSHIMQLHAKGYEFLVSADVFIVHMPHAPSFDITKYRLNKQYRSCLKKLKLEFIRDLEKVYSTTFR